MLILSIFLFVLGSYVWMHSSKRAVFPTLSIGSTFRKHPRFSKIAGLLSLSGAFLFMILHSGIGAGIFYGLIILMTLLSFWLLVLPLILATNKKNN